MKSLSGVVICSKEEVVEANARIYPCSCRRARRCSWLKAFSTSGDTHLIVATTMPGYLSLVSAASLKYLQLDNRRPRRGGVVECASLILVSELLSLLWKISCATPRR